MFKKIILVLTFVIMGMLLAFSANANTTYTVQKGETISTILSNKLKMKNIWGPSGLVAQTIALNKAALHGKAYIKPGMVLQIPDGTPVVVVAEKNIAPEVAVANIPDENEIVLNEQNPEENISKIELNAGITLRNFSYEVREQTKKLNEKEYAFVTENGSTDQIVDDKYKIIDPAALRVEVKDLDLKIIETSMGIEPKSKQVKIENAAVVAKKDDEADELLKSEAFKKAILAQVTTKDKVSNQDFLNDHAVSLRILMALGASLLITVMRKKLIKKQV